MEVGNGTRSNKGRCNHVYKGPIVKEEKVNMAEA